MTDKTKKLEEWILKQLNNGKEPEEIKKQVLNVGWKEAEIDIIMDKFVVLPPKNETQDNDLKMPELKTSLFNKTIKASGDSKEVKKLKTLLKSKVLICPKCNTALIDTDVSEFIRKETEAIRAELEKERSKNAQSL